MDAPMDIGTLSQHQVPQAFHQVSNAQFEHPNQNTSSSGELRPAFHAHLPTSTWLCQF